MAGRLRYWQKFGWHGAPGSSLWQTLVPRHFDVSAENIIEGLRAGVACAVPVFVGEALHYPDVSWAAIAAFWMCLADPGGAIRTRFAALTTLAILGALSSAAAIWATDLNIWVAVGLGFVWSFAGSLARIYGEAGAKIGLFVLLTFLVSIGNFEGRAVAPGAAALLYLAGASWALILTLILWRVHPYGPSRRALALVYDELAGLAAGLAKLRSAAKLDGDPFGAMARAHRRRIREALDAAGKTITNVRRTHIGTSRRADQQLTLWQCAEKIFATLIALSDLLEAAKGQPAGTTPDAAVVDRIDRLPALLETLSAATLTGNASIAAPLDAKLSELRRSAIEAGSPEQAADRASSRALYRQLIDTVFLYASIAADAATDVAPRPRLAEIAELLPDRQSSLRQALFAPLAQNLSFDSIPLQHSLRLAVAASIAVLITFWFELGHGYWLTMTTVLILQPYAATTWQLSLKRIVGSVLGGVLAAALGTVVHTPLAIAIVIFPISIATMFFRTVDYGLYVLFLTPQFVLISALGEPGTGDLALSWLRGVNSVLGGVLALAAGMLLWPGRELQRLPVEIGKVIAANRDYLLLIIKAQRDGIPSHIIDASRRLAGLASNNAEASVERLLSEPGNDPVVLEAAMTIVTSARRLTGAIAVLGLLSRKAETQRAMPVLAAFDAWIADALQVMANAARSNAAPAALEAKPEFPRPTTAHEGESEDADRLAHDRHANALLADVVARICRQIEIIHAALARLAAPQPAQPPIQQ